jgi:hypothetical protein
MPTQVEVEAALPKLIQAAKERFASPPVTTTTFGAVEKKSKPAKAK